MRLLPLLALGALATDAVAQSSQERGLHITTVSSPSPGGIEILVTPDAKADKAIGATPNAKDFTVWLGGGAAPNLTVGRNGSRGKPLTTIVLLDESGSYKTGHGQKVALPAIFDYGKDAGTDEMALIVFSLDTTAFPVHQGPADFMKDLQGVGARKAHRATSVTIGLTKALEVAEKEGEAGLREIIIFTDGLDEADVDKAVWATTIARARELGVRVSVLLPTDETLPKFTNKADHERWVTTTTNLNRIATDSGGVYMASWDPVDIATKLRDARTALKSSIVLDGKLCGAKSGQAVDVRVEYVPNAKREAWSAGAQLQAAAWAPGSDAPCPSLCTTACSAWEECIAGTCAARACTADSGCAGAVCVAGFCGKQCSPTCSDWQECRSGACAARACAGDENCGAGSHCDKGMCTTPATKSSGKLIWILAGAGALLLLAALFVLFRKKPEPEVVPLPVEPEPEPVVEETKPDKNSVGVDLDPLPETHLVAIGGWATPGERWRLHKRKTVAGASSDPGDGVDLVFGGIKQVSSKHAQFDLYPSGDLWVADLGSSNGTFVNGKKVSGKERAKLVPGDQVKLSQNLVLVVERPGASSTDDIPASSGPAPAAEPEAPAVKSKAATKFDPGGR